MKVAILGAGALGGVIGAKLAQTNAQVSLVARGPHLEAMQDNGVTLIDPEGYVNLDPVASHTTAFMGAQDYVFVTLRAHQVAGAMDLVAPLLGPETTVVWAITGTPYWDRDAPPVAPAQVLGCAPLLAADVATPGVIRHLAGDTLVLGEANGKATPRAKRLAQLLEETGLRAPVVPDIRTHVWAQLMVVLSVGQGLELPPEAAAMVAQTRASVTGIDLPQHEVWPDGAAMWQAALDGDLAELEAVLEGIG